MGLKRSILGMVVGTALTVAGGVSEYNYFSNRDRSDPTLEQAQKLDTYLRTPVNKSDLYVNDDTGEEKSRIASAQKEYDALASEVLLIKEQRTKDDLVSSLGTIVFAGGVITLICGSAATRNTLRTRRKTLEDVA